MAGADDLGFSGNAQLTGVTADYRL
jgi:hypothetical protein